MSLLVETSPKHCAKKGFHIKPHLNKRLLYIFSAFVSSILFIIFIVWLVLHPSKPEFYLKDATIYELALSPHQLMNASVQATLVTKNPNARVGIYYDRLRAYVVYNDQQITALSSLPPFYQDHLDANLLSTSLCGIGVPVAPSVGYEVSRDQVEGRMFLVLKLDGQMRWKVGSWVSARYRFNVDCVAVVGFRPGGGASLELLLGAVEGSNQCSTSV